MADPRKEPMSSKDRVDLAITAAVLTGVLGLFAAIAIPISLDGDRKSKLPTDMQVCLAANPDNNWIYDGNNNEFVCTKDTKVENK